MKKILTILLTLLALNTYSQVTLRKGFISLQNNDTVWMTYSNGTWTMESDTTFNVTIDTLYFSDGTYKVTESTTADSNWIQITSDTIITRKIKSPVDSLIIQSGQGYTKFIPNTSANLNWKILPDSIVQYNSYIYNDRLAFISEVSSAGGSSGDIQYNNSGTLDGAPMTTDGTDITLSNILKLDTLSANQNTVIESLNRMNFKSANNTSNLVYIDSNHVYLTNSNLLGGTSSFNLSGSYNGNSTFSGTLRDNANTYSTSFQWLPSQYTNTIKTTTQDKYSRHIMYASTLYHELSCYDQTGYKTSIEMRPTTPYYTLNLYNQNNTTTNKNEIYLDTTSIKFSYAGSQYAKFSPDGMLVDTIIFGDDTKLYSFDTIDLKTAVESETFDYVTTGKVITDTIQSNDLYMTGDISYDKRHAFLYYNSDYAPDITQNVYLKVNPTFLVVEDSHITFAGDSLTIEDNGDYVSSFTFVISGGNGDDFTIQFRLNGTSVKETRQSTGGAGDYNTVILWWYFNGLTTGDDISIWITNTNSSGDATLSNMTWYTSKEHGEGY